MPSPQDLSLIADIGGTNARFGLCNTEGGLVTHVEVLKCADFAGPAAAAAAYLEKISPAVPVRRAAFCVASPVNADQVTLTNHPWSFSIGGVRSGLALQHLTVINDFRAIALAVPRLTGKDLTPIGGGTVNPNAPIAVIGPGTGLGVALLVPGEQPSSWLPVSTEGGHVTLAAATSREAAMIDDLRSLYGHVSAERVISGSGLVTLYEALCRLDGKAAPDNLAPAGVTAAALDGSDPVAMETLTMFAALLGTVAANLCLSTGAQGGLYIGGGIIPKLGHGFPAETFRKRFEDKGRFSDYLAAIPTHVITAEYPAFTGLQALLLAEQHIGGT